MKRAMKHVALASMLVMALGFLKGAWAASNATLNLTVTPGCTRGVTIVTAGNQTTYDFSSVSFGQTTGSTKAITVTNTGTCGDTWVISMNATTGQTWTSAAGGATGKDTFNLYALFSTVQSSTGTIAASAANLVSTTGTTCATAGNYTTGTTGGSCSSIPPTGAAASQSLWLALQMPTSQSAVTQSAVTIPLVITTQ